MSTKIKRRYEIVGGPSKDLLFDACKYAYSKTAKVKLEFKVPIAYTVPPGDPGCAYLPMEIEQITLCRIEHEDGSGESFNLHGYCMADTKPNGGQTEPYTFDAYYRTDTRKGVLNLISSN